MFDKHSKLMTAAGLISFAFFLISNFTSFFTGSRVLAGIIQLCINAFVIIVCKNALPHSKGVKKFFAIYGIIVPAALAFITIVRVLIPAAIR
jgi:hypothetical protein